MQGITTINYVSKDAPNILLIANNSNHINSGIHLKYFKNTHNIYVIFHDFKEDGDKHSFYYQDLTTYHKQIVEELDKHNLYKFTLSALSFGCYLAYYMIFYLPERIEKAFIFDYHWNLTQRILNNRITANNWIIPKTCTIPVIVYICRKNPAWSTSQAFITPLEAISLLRK